MWCFFGLDFFCWEFQPNRTCIFLLGFGNKVGPACRHPTWPASQNPWLASSWQFFFAAGQLALRNPLVAAADAILLPTAAPDHRCPAAARLRELRPAEPGPHHYPGQGEVADLQYSIRHSLSLPNFGDEFCSALQADAHRRQIITAVSFPQAQPSRLPDNFPGFLRGKNHFTPSSV